MLPSPDWLPNLQQVHPSLKGLFPTEEIIAPQAGRTQKFLANWKLITNDQEILNIVKGWEIPLTDIPIQNKVPQELKMNSLKSQAMDKEVVDMLAKGAIRVAILKEDQFLSIFVRGRDITALS